MLNKTRPREITHDEFRVQLLTEGTLIENLAGCDYVQVRPQVVTELHLHERSNTVVFVVSGHGFVEIDGKEFPVSAGERLEIAAGKAHGFRTDIESLTFVSVSVPPIVSPETGVPDVEVIIPAKKRCASTTNSWNIPTNNRDH